jgi:hypothetical protein
MSAAKLSTSGIEDVLRHVVSDQELEAAAEETALSYTYETSASNPCCL